jgi:SAM-dependent methyltransferase
MAPRNFATADPFHGVVHLRSMPLEPEVVATRLRYIEEFGADPENRGGWYHDDDWQRISFVLRSLRSGSTFLDVGCGAGQFLKAVALTGRFSELHASDPTRFTKYREYEPGIERAFDSVHELPYDDDSFDVVTCMEVLEHVDDDIFEPAIVELQRVCRGQLIVSVPYQEPEPISRTHQRRFEADDIRRTFPGWDRVLLDRPRMPWAMAELWCGAGSEVSSVRLNAAELRTQMMPDGNDVLEAMTASVSQKVPARLKSPLRTLRSRLR